MRQGMVEEVVGRVKGTGGEYAVVIVYGTAEGLATTACPEEAGE